MKNIFLILLIAIAFTYCNTVHDVHLSSGSNGMDVSRSSQTLSTDVDEYSGDKTNPKNIILLIGDGMGISQITAGLYTNGNKLELERFNDIGLHKTHSADTLITDSAAGATAFASGIKTYNGAVGVGPQGERVRTILEEAEAKKKATGLVATSTIVHATPGSFIAHQEHRYMYEEIASDFLKTDIDVFIGGGKKYFTRRIMDDRNLFDELTKKGYLVRDYFDSELSDIKVIPNQKIAFLTSDIDPLPASRGRDYLQKASMLAIDQLSKNSDSGFFLMIEGSQIDWGGHSNNSDYIISEMLEFDQVIGKVLDWVIKDKNTLLIVTADHETGGYAINGGSMGRLETGFTTTGHTADMIPVFAYGPGSAAFRGIYDNTAIYDKMRAAFKFK